MTNITAKLATAANTEFCQNTVQRTDSRKTALE